MKCGMLSTFSHRNWNIRIGKSTWNVRIICVCMEFISNIKMKMLETLRKAAKGEREREKWRGMKRLIEMVWMVFHTWQKCAFDDTEQYQIITINSSLKCSAILPSLLLSTRFITTKPLHMFKVVINFWMNTLTRTRHHIHNIESPKKLIVIYRLPSELIVTSGLSFFSSPFVLIEMKHVPFKCNNIFNLVWLSFCYPIQMSIPEVLISTAQCKILIEKEWTNNKRHSNDIKWIKERRNRIKTQTTDSEQRTPHTCLYWLNWWNYTNINY